MVVLTAFLQSSKRPASCMIIHNQSVQTQQDREQTYTLNGSCLHAELGPKLRSKLFSSIFARDIVDGDIATFGRELLGDGCS